MHLLQTQIILYSHPNHYVCMLDHPSAYDALLFMIEGLNSTYASWTRRVQLTKFIIFKSLWITHEIGTPMSTHLSKFNSIFSQLVALENVIHYEYKARFFHVAKELGYLQDCHEQFKCDASVC
mgnify:FL=1